MLNNKNIKLDDEVAINDLKDRGIYRTAKRNRIDLIVTGDNHFQVEGLKGIKIMKASEFLNED